MKPGSFETLNGFPTRPISHLFGELPYFKTQ